MNRATTIVDTILFWGSVGPATGESKNAPCPYTTRSISLLLNHLQYTNPLLSSHHSRIAIPSVEGIPIPASPVNPPVVDPETTAQFLATCLFPQPRQPLGPSAHTLSTEPLPEIGEKRELKNRNPTGNPIASHLAPSILFPLQCSPMNAADLAYLGLPTTLDEAVECLNDTLGPDDKRTLRETLEDDLVDCHFGLGLAIRNAFELHRGNPDLLAACGTTHPDDASTVILTALWHRLQDNARNV